MVKNPVPSFFFRFSLVYFPIYFRDVHDSGSVTYVNTLRSPSRSVLRLSKNLLRELSLVSFAQYVRLIAIRSRFNSASSTAAGVPRMMLASFGGSQRRRVCAAVELRSSDA